MNINLTFILQTGNFLATYWFLKKFLFAPFIAQIQQKKQKEKELLETINQQKDSFEKLEIEKTTELLSFQDHVRKTYAIPESTLFKVVIERPVRPNQAEIEKQVNEVCAYLSREVPNVY